MNVEPQIQLARYQKIASDLGCDDASGTKWNSGRRNEILQCMKTVEQTKVADAERDLPSFFWGPRVKVVYCKCLFPFAYSWITALLSSEDIIHDVKFYST